MSTRLSNEPVRQQPPNIYTVMLILSAVFMLIAVIAMFIELRRWAPDYHRTQSAEPTAMQFELSAVDAPRIV